MGSRLRWRLWSEFNGTPPHLNLTGLLDLSGLTTGLAMAISTPILRTRETKKMKLPTVYLDTTIPSYRFDEREELKTLVQITKPA